MIFYPKIKAALMDGRLLKNLLPFRLLFSLLTVLLRWINFLPWAFNFNVLRAVYLRICNYRWISCFLPKSKFEMLFFLDVNYGYEDYLYSMKFVSYGTVLNQGKVLCEICDSGLLINLLEIPSLSLGFLKKKYRKIQ